MSSVSQTLPISEMRHAPVMLRRFRLRLVRQFASLLTRVGRWPVGSRFIVRLRSSPTLRAMAERCLAFRSTFASFADAQSCASKYIPSGHEHPDETLFHLSISGKLRESDYPLLFHLASLMPSVRRIFDLGGNIGNLFYSYQKQLTFPADLTWTVYDIPAVRSLGEHRAAERGETRLRFVSAVAAGKGSDVFIASGSLHYFEEHLDLILQQMGSFPAHVFVNRTPCSSGEDLTTVQDNGTFLVPCKLHSRANLIDRMQRAGYRLVAEWPVFELNLWVPLYPDLCSRNYSGFYFRKE